MGGGLRGVKVEGKISNECTNNNCKYFGWYGKKMYTDNLS